jgi:exonuclease SbcD
MKFMHLGDVHLGKSLGDFDLFDDQRYMLNRIVETAVKMKVDAILIAGDVYDRALPGEQAVVLLDTFLNMLVENGIKVFIISGNHDSDERLGYGSRMFEKSGVYIRTKYEGILDKETVTDGFGEIDIWFLPFVKASQVKHYHPDEKIATYDDAVRTIIKNAGIDTGRRNVILSHQFVSGSCADPELGGSECTGTRSVGQIEKIACDCFDPFDYAALGHIHSPQAMGRKEVRYSGSPIKYSLSEVDNDKSIPVVTMGEKGNVDIELVKIKPLRDMRHLKGPLAKLIDENNVTGTDDFIYATLTDEDIIDDAMGIMQQVYPNTVKIDYDNSHTREIRQMEIEDAVRHMTFEEIAKSFYEKMFGCSISDEEMRILKEAAKEAGADETC